MSTHERPDAPSSPEDSAGEADAETLRRRPRTGQAKFPSAQELTRYIPPRIGERTLLVLDAQQGAFEPASGDSTLFQIDGRGTAHEAPQGEGTLLDIEAEDVAGVDAGLGPREDAPSRATAGHERAGEDGVREESVVPLALRSLESPWQGEQGRKLSELARALRERVQQAREAQAAWAGASFAERVAVVRRLRHTLYRRSAELTARLGETLAQPPVESLLSEVLATCDLLAEYERSAPEWLAPRRRNCANATLAGGTTWVELEHLPTGVVGLAGGACHPLAELCRTLAAAVLTGNGLVAVLGVEGSLATALQDVCQPAELGLDARLVQVLPGSPGGRMALAASGVDHLVTGGDATHVDPKVSVYRQGGGSTTLLLETHVSAPMLVRPDAKIHAAAQAATTSAFRLHGMALGALGRVYVAEEQAESFVEMCATLAKESQQRVAAPGDPANDGWAVASPEAREQAHALVEQATDLGARLVFGGRRESRSGDDAAQPTWHPAVLGDCTDEMPAVWQHFVPLLCVVPVERAQLDEHFVEAANHLPCLAASIFTGELDTAREIARRLRVTHVAVNDEPRMFLEARAPYAVPAALGYGVVHGPEALLEFTRLRTRLVSESHASPKPWWFPYTKAKHEHLRSLLARRHAPSLWTRLKSRWRRPGRHS